MKYRSLVLSLALMFLLVAGISCSSVDCPMNSLVYTQYAVCNADGSTATLQDTLTISTNRADGNDSVLINRDVNISSFSLPISYSMPEDSFFIALKDTLLRETLDTLVVSKQDLPHFESPECAPAYFHKITAVSCTHHGIDSVAINYPDVNYDTSKKHLYIYFSPR